MKNIHLMLWLLLPIFSAAQDIITTESQIGFSIKNAGLTVNGSFSDYSGNVNFNPNDLANAKVKVSIKTTSINTGIEMRDGHLRKEEYFDVAHFSNMNFESKRFEKKGDNYTVYGTLTIKGVSKEVSFPFQYKKIGAKNSVSASVKINRRDFGVGGKSWIMSDEVLINLFIIFA